MQDVRVGVRLDTPTRAALDALAKREQRTVSEVLRRALAAYLLREQHRREAQSHV